MAIKNLGHYEGTVEDIDTTSAIFKLLNKQHQELIILSKEKNNLSNRIKEIDKQIEEIKSEIKPQVKSGKIKWAWIWIKKSGRVKWKEEFVKALGIKKAESISKSYQTKEYLKLVLSI